MTAEQIVGAKFHAEKLAQAAHALCVLDEIEGVHPDVSFLRGFHRKEMGKQLASLAAELGFRLAPVAGERKSATADFAVVQAGAP